MNSCLVGMKRIPEISKQNDMSAKKVAKVVKPVKVVKPIKNNLYTGGDGEPFKPTITGIPDLEPLTQEQVNGIAEMAKDSLSQEEGSFPCDKSIRQEVVRTDGGKATFMDVPDDYEKLIGKFLIEAQLDKGSRYTIMVGGPKGRVVIERFGADPTIVFSDSLIEAIQKISG